MGEEISKSEPILRYYIFQKKINGYLRNTIKNRKEKFNSKEGFIVNPELIKEWKIRINYKQISRYCQEFRIETYKKQTELQKKLIHDFIEKDYQVRKNVFYINSCLIKNNDFPYTYNKNMSDNWETFINLKIYDALKINSKNKAIKIKYILKQKLLILFFKDDLLMKMIVEGKHLTFLFTKEIEYERYKEIFKCSTSDAIISYLNNRHIFSLPEFKNYGQKSKKKYIEYKVINEEYLKKDNQQYIIKPPENIDFSLQKRVCYRGLENVGATCYMNATLQCLSNIKPVTDFLLEQNNYIYLNDNKALCPLTLSYTQVLIGLFLDKSITGSYRPENFKNMISDLNPLFQGIQANDSKDLIIFLLEVMNNELVKIHNKKEKIIQNQNEIMQSINIYEEKSVLTNFLDNFQKNHCTIIGKHLCGFNKSTFLCQNCSHSAINFNIFNFLIFSLEATSKYFKLINNISIPTINFDQCFQFLSKVESFQDTYCQFCSLSCPSKYRENIYSMPNYLIIILNRGKGNIFRCNVIIPKEFNSSNYTEKKDKYNEIFELIGVVSHFGESGMGGHFISFCKHNIDGKWRCFNDSIVTECYNDEYLQKGTPYILFYKKKNNNKLINQQKKNLQNGNINHPNMYLQNGNINLNNQNNNFQQNKNINKNNNLRKSLNNNIFQRNIINSNNRLNTDNNNIYKQNMNIYNCNNLNKSWNMNTFQQNMNMNNNNFLQNMNFKK